ncbi:MAG: alpha/beta hydrolase [Chitinophagales bacterium]
MEFTLISGENPIVVTAFTPRKQNGITIIMSCATGAKQSYFKPFATYLAEHGFLVFTYDYSGIGRSKPTHLKGFNTSASAWGKLDLTTVIDHVAQNYEYNKLLLIGQSIGGQIPGLSPSINKVDGLINVVSQSGYWNLWPFPLNIGLLFNWYLLKVMTSLLGYFPGKKWALWKIFLKV